MQNPIEMPIVFKIGAGIVPAVSITQLLAIHNDVHMAALNTCKTRAAWLGTDSAPRIIGGKTRLLTYISDLKQNPLLSEQRDLMDKLANIIRNLEDYMSAATQRLIQQTNFLSILGAISNKNVVLTMNFVGYADWDDSGVNRNTNQILLNKFLANTNINTDILHKNQGLIVLIDKNRNCNRLSNQESRITNSLLNFFKENNFPRVYKQTGEPESFTLFNEKSIDKANERNRFRIVHYIQSLVTAIMFRCVNEPAENREIIFRNITNLLDRELNDGADWTNSNQNEDAVDFLIEKILSNANLQNEIGNTLSIKVFAKEVYEQLDKADHVTQIEFIKLNLHERRIEDGFLTKDGCLCVPLSKILKKCSNDIPARIASADDITNILDFLDKIEKYALRFSLENSIELERAEPSDITDENWTNALVDLENISPEQQRVFINKFQGDKETVNILEAALGNYTNESFPSVPAEIISELKDDDQNKHFRDHIDVITQVQLAAFRPAAIKNFVDLTRGTNNNNDNNNNDNNNKEGGNDAGKNSNNNNNNIQIDEGKRQQFINFIMRLGQHLTREQLVPVDFSLLNDNCRTHLLLYHELNDISLNQIKQVSLSTLEANRQALILRDRINDLTADQIHFFDMSNLPSCHDFSKTDCLHLILNQRFNDLSDEQIMQIDFRNLTVQERELILTNKLHLVTEVQLQNLNLRELRSSKPQIYRAILEQKFSVISPDQLSNLEISEQLPEESMAMFRLFKRQTEYIRFLRNPNENTLTREILESMPDDAPEHFKFNFQLIYLFHYMNLIPDNVKDLFAPAIKYIFENPSPNRCPSEIFNSLLDENVWPSDLIELQVIDTNINEFPRMFLPKLVSKYGSYLSNESKNAFDINLYLGSQGDSADNRITVFDFWLTNYNDNRGKIEQIDIQNLNQNEIEMLINQAANYLTAQQTTQIDLSILFPETLSLFLSTILPKGTNYISDAQINTLNCANPSVISLIVNANRAKCLTLEQIRSIDLNQLGQATSNLIAMKIEKMVHKENIITTLAAEGIEDPVWCFEMLTANQIQQISFDWINEIIRTYFFSRVSNFLTQQQVESINFEFDNSCKKDDVRCRILNNLLAAHKLHFLQGEQLCQLNNNIFKFRDENLVRTLFSMYASFYTHNQNIAIDQIPNSFLNLNLGNVETGLLNYIVKNMCSDLTLAHIQQINLQNLSKDVLNNLIANRLTDLSQVQISSLNLQLITPDNDNFYRLINERCTDITNEQLNSFDRDALSQISFAKLTIESQARLLAIYNIKFLMPTAEQIGLVDLQSLEKTNDKIYNDTLMSFSNLLSIDQFMTVNWLKPNLEQFAAFNFLGKLGVEEENQLKLYRLLCANEQTLELNWLEDIPDEHLDHFKVAMLNSRFLNQQFDFIDDDQRENFFGAMKIMFGLPKAYLQSVEYIINHWNNVLHEQIQHLKTIVDFSPATVNTLLRDYLSDLSVAQLQGLSVENLAVEIINNALLERAADFSMEQLCVILSLQNAIDLSDENIPTLQMQQMPAILINYLVNKKLALLTESQISDLLINRFNDVREQQIVQCSHVLSGEQLNNLHINDHENFLSLFNKCALEFTQGQLTDEHLTSDAIQSLTIDAENQNVAAVLLLYRVNDLTAEQIQAMNFRPEEIIHVVINQINGGDGLTIIRSANRYKDLSANQFDTMLNYTGTRDIIQILNENLEDMIIESNAAQINLAQVYDALSDMPDRNERFTRLFNACALFFTLEQLRNENLSQEAIQNIIIGPDNQHVAGILLMYRIKDLSPNQIQNVNLYAPEGDDRINPDLYMRRYAQAITLRRVNHNALTLLCEANRFKDLSDAQLNSMIDFSYTPNIIQILSENIEDRINNEAKAQQIDLVQVYDALNDRPDRNEIFTRLFNACVLFFTADQINALSQEAIQNIIIGPDNQHVAGILLLYRINDLSTNQIQNVNLYVPSNDEERNPELCLKKYARVITMRRANETAVNLLMRANRFKDLSDDQLNNMLSFTRTANIIQILSENIEDRINNKANAQKINLVEVYNTLHDMPDRNEQFTRLFNTCALFFTTDQINALSQEAIQSIIIRPDNQHVAGILLMCRIQDITREQIQAMYLYNPSDEDRNNPELCLKKYAKVITLQRVNKNTLDLLIEANRYHDLSDYQLNNMLNFACTDNIIQFLKENIGRRVASISTAANIQQINLSAVWIKIKNDNTLRPRFFEFIAAFDDLKLTILAERENNLPNSVALGLFFIRHIRSTLTGNNLVQAVAEHIHNLVTAIDNNQKFDEVYFAECILLATRNIPNCAIEPAEEKAFWREFWHMCRIPDTKKLHITQKIRYKHKNDLVYGDLDTDGFKITPDDLQYIVLQKFRTWNTPNKTDAYKKDRINEKVARLSSYFRCSLESEYRNKLEQIKAKQVRRGANESEFIIDAEI